MRARGKKSHRDSLPLSLLVLRVSVFIFDPFLSASPTCLHLFAGCSHARNNAQRTSMYLESSVFLRCLCSFPECLREPGRLIRLSPRIRYKTAASVDEGKADRRSGESRRRQVSGQLDSTHARSANEAVFVNGSTVVSWVGARIAPLSRTVDLRWTFNSAYIHSIGLRSTIELELERNSRSPAARGPPRSLDPALPPMPCRAYDFDLDLDEVGWIARP